MPATIKQLVSICAEHKKPRKLLKLLDSLLPEAAPSAAAAAAAAAPSAAARVLIFANKIKSVAFVTTLLQRHGIVAEALSSRLSQAERDGLLRRFRAGHLPVLVATDVAARGVHIDELKHVVCWDYGTNIEQYVHRIGRTGRNGRAGTAHAFFTRALRPLAPAALQLLEDHGQPIDQYLRALAEEATREATALSQPAAPTAAAAVAAAAAAAAPPAAVAAAPPPLMAPLKRKAMTSHDVHSESDDEAAEGPIPRWLAAKLVSPITGGIGLFQAPGSKKEAKKKKRKTGEHGGSHSSVRTPFE